jgi:hypothetical protein
MKRLLTLWLTLLGAFWLTRAVASAVVFQRVADRGGRALFLLLAVPVFQTALLSWLTRRTTPGTVPPPAGSSGRADDDVR